MLVTVAICTWNRAQLLDQTLQRMHEMRIPEGVTWELLVVNNNCTDDTDVIIERHAQSLPIRRLFEPEPGLSNARNCVISHCRGELILWTDDDVLVDAEWVAEYVSAARRWPEAAYFGGTIDPWYSTRPPAWITLNIKKMEFLYAIRQFGESTRPLAEGEDPFGANMAIRSRVLQPDSFDPRLGVKGSSLIRGEETSLFVNLRKSGHWGIWVGSARVNHYIPPSRMTSRYVWEWNRGCGISMAIVGGGEPGGKLLFGVPRWIFKKYALEQFRSLIHLPFKDSTWFESFTRSAILRGMMVGYSSSERRLAREPLEGLH